MSVNTQACAKAEIPSARPRAFPARELAFGSASTMQSAKKPCETIAEREFSETSDGISLDFSWRIDTSPLFSATYRKMR
jgi:hypothetical protein